ncbi:MAG: LamG domain-containing protein [Candidatus Micrarchaeota archaeon]|nr:LamG domain-containing protein [Candidatus Micrarchaeota archaeon]
MEYLMTYGWAILAIAVVMVSLYSIGIFNLGSLTPTATPGACQVIRTAAQTSLAGQCNNLMPKYVGQFNGQNAYVNLGNSAALSPEAGTNGKMSFCLWYYINTDSSLTGFYGPMLKGMNSPSSGSIWEYTIGQYSDQSFTVWIPSGASPVATEAGPAPSAKQWYFACFTYDYAASSASFYVNGVQYIGTFNSGTPAGQGTGKLVLGAGENGYSKVYIADVQLYNTSLDAATIKTLYHEGIGGAPADVTHLVGWWPLNGNANDYSGNNNQGAPINVIWNANWQSGYTAPAS